MTGGEESCWPHATTMPRGVNSCESRSYTITFLQCTGLMAKVLSCIIRIGFSG